MTAGFSNRLTLVLLFAVYFVALQNVPQAKSGRQPKNRAAAGIW